MTIYRDYPVWTISTQGLIQPCPKCGEPGHFLYEIAAHQGKVIVLHDTDNPPMFGWSLEHDGSGHLCVISTEQAGERPTWEMIRAKQRELGIAP